MRWFSFRKTDSTPRRRRHKATPQLDQLDDRIVPAYLGAGYFGAISPAGDFTRTPTSFNRTPLGTRQYFNFLGSQARSVTSATRSYQTALNRLVTQYNQGIARALTQYNTSLDRLAGQFAGEIDRSGTSFLDQFSRTGVAPSTLFSPQFQTSFMSSVDRLQAQTATQLAQVNSQFSRSLNSLSGRFANYGTPFSATTADVNAALTQGFNDINSAFGNLSAADRTLFNDQINALGDFTRNFDFTASDALNTFRNDLAGFRTGLATNLTGGLSPFNTSLATTSTNFGTSLADINSRFNNSFTTTFGTAPFAGNPLFGTISPLGDFTRTFDGTGTVTPTRPIGGTPFGGLGGGFPGTINGGGFGGFRPTPFGGLGGGFPGTITGGGFGGFGGGFGGLGGGFGF